MAYGYMPHFPHGEFIASIINYSNIMPWHGFAYGASFYRKQIGARRNCHITFGLLFNYKIKLIRDAQGWKKPDRTPFNSNMFTWMFHEAGYTTAQATRDYDIIEKCMVRYVTKYKVDMINAGNSGFRNAFLVMDSLGSGSSYSDKESQNLNAVIEDVFTPDDYDAVKENFQKAIWERALFRRYPAASAYSPEKFAEAVKTLYDLNEARARIDTRMRDEFGIVCERSWLNFFPGYEYFFKYFRGIKGVAMDLRRCPEKLYEVSDAIDEVNVKNCEDFLFREADGINWNEPYDVMIGMLGHTIVLRLFIKCKLSKATGKPAALFMSSFHRPDKSFYFISTIYSDLTALSYTYTPYRLQAP